jgi:hypothetical protein
MASQSELMAAVSDTSERFDTKTIFMRDEDDFMEHVDTICKSLEVLEGVKYVGAEINDDETAIFSKWKTKPIEVSRLRMLTIRFKLTFKEETMDIEKTIQLPRIVDNFFFVLGGVRSFPILRAVDVNFVVTPELYSIKTLLMPVRFKYKKAKRKTTSGEVIKYRSFTLNIFKYALCPMSYFFAKFGVFETVSYFGLNYGEDFSIIELGRKALQRIHEDEEFVAFHITGDHYVKLRRSVLEDPGMASVACMIIAHLEHASSFEDNPDFWISKLGNVFTKTASSYHDKGMKILFSLERIVNENSKENLPIPAEHKLDTYGVLRWMLLRFEEHRRMDSMDLEQKKIQCWEYLLEPLLLHFSKRAYATINTRTMSIKTLKNMFNIREGFLLGKYATNELLRFAGCVNDCDLFNAALRMTFAGASGSGQEVTLRARGIHPSYVGNVGLVTSSASNPGMTATIVPFAQVRNCRFRTDSASKMEM